MGYFHFCDESSVLPGFLIIGAARVWVGKIRKFPMSGVCPGPLLATLGVCACSLSPTPCPGLGSWCLWGSRRWLWLLELGGLEDKELRRKRLQLEVVQGGGVLGWSLLVPELLPQRPLPSAGRVE